LSAQTNKELVIKTHRIHTIVTLIALKSYKIKNSPKNAYSKINFRNAIPDEKIQLLYKKKRNPRRLNAVINAKGRHFE
jgi:hypothetical protein